MAVYIDVIWALNFLFDTLLLYLTTMILKRKVKFWRLLMGGFIGSIIILLSITPLQHVAHYPITKLFFSIIMILVVFGYKKLRYFLNALMALYFSTFLVGGILIGVHYFMQFDPKISTNVLLAGGNGFGDPISWLFVLIGLPLAWHFSKTAIDKVEMTKIYYDQIINVYVEMGNTKMKFKGLIDSGNQLHDPLSGMPVMFVSINHLMDSLPANIIKLTEDSSSIIFGKERMDREWEHTMRIIPYKVVGQEHQLVIAVKPDKIMIEKNNELLRVENGLISFTKQQLSIDNAFECIVHPKMLMGAKSVKVS